MRLAAALCALLAATPALAQDQTLADIRQELSVLYVEIQRLRAELNTTGGASGSGASGTTIDRANAMEAEVQRLTAATERLQLDIDSVVRDGTNRIGDLEFRLCELEPACDVSTLGETPFLGGVTPGSAGSAPAAGGGFGATPLPDAGGGAVAPVPGGGNLAVAEQGDFDRARAAFEAGNYADAALLFQTFTESYPGGLLSAEAHFLRGQAEVNQARWSQAARAFLDSFTAQPEGQRAPASLTALGVSLARLGQTDEACLTLAEVSVRYPGSASVAEAEAERGRLGCR